MEVEFPLPQTILKVEEEVEEEGIMQGLTQALLEGEVEVGQGEGVAEVREEDLQPIVLGEEELLDLAQ